MELEGRHVVVTGAASGIGRALALRFADEGARAVVVSDLDEAGAQAVAEQVGGLAVRTDVGREEEIRALVARAEAANGPIDLFFSNAGITGPSGGPDVLGDADWDLLWRVNTMAHVWAARALLPGMLERGEGYLASTASAAGLLAQLGALGYTVTKHAAVAVAEWLSMTYGDRGIRVSCLCPQYVRTPMVTDGELPLDKLESVATILEPEQVADAVVDAIREERFLILPHPEVGTYMAQRGDDHDRWLRGMRRLQGQLGV
jgi:NAD(P)-dependent dehydrogenase (short-subunit alcohol dehydrogenase family)